MSMDEIITNEFIQYKTGFSNGKNDFIEFTKLGKQIHLDNQEEKVTTEWYDFGYKDAIEFFSEAMNHSIDITTIRIKDVVKEQYIKRVILQNSENQKKTPMSTFRM